MNSQREDKSLPFFLVIKGKAKGCFFSPLGSASISSKPEKKNSEGEERKKGKRREEKGKKKEERLGLFHLKVCSWFVWFFLAILMVEWLDFGMCSIQIFSGLMMKLLG